MDRVLTSASLEERLAAMRRVLRRRALRTRDAETALRYGNALGRLCWLNIDGLLADDALEVALDARHGPTLCALTGRFVPPAGEWDWLHVLSEAYDTGGHTRLAEILMAEQARGGARVAVVITRAGTPRFAQFCMETGVARLTVSGGLTDRAAALLAQGRRAARIALHIHPDDLGAALAARRLRAEGRRVLFVNHADHVFSWGPGAADVVLEVSGFGWRRTAEARQARVQGFLGIPALVSHAASRISSLPPAPNAPVMSMGHASKYRPAPGLDFPAFVEHLLARTEHPFELIGPTGQEPWWRGAVERFPGRLCFAGPLPYEKAAARLSSAACYIDSFPVGGGTAMLQALSTGLTVFGLGSETAAYSPLDALRSRSPEILADDVAGFLERGAELPLQTEIRRRVATDFSPAAVAARLKEAADGRLAPLPPDMSCPSRGADFHPRAWRAGGIVFAPAPAPAPTGLRLAVVAASLRDPRVRLEPPRSRRDWLLHGARAAAGGA